MKYLLLFLLIPFFGYSQDTLNQIQTRYITVGLSIGLPIPRSSPLLGIILESVKSDSFGGFLILRTSTKSSENETVQNNIILGINRSTGADIRFGAGISLQSIDMYNKYYDENSLARIEGKYYLKTESSLNAGLFLSVFKRFPNGLNFHVGYTISKFSSFDTGISWEVSNHKNQ